MNTHIMRQAGLAALLTCGLVLFMPANTFAQGGGGGGGGGGGHGPRGAHRGGPGADKGGPGCDKDGPGVTGDARPGAMGSGSADGLGGQNGMKNASGPKDPFKPGIRDPGVNQRERNQEGRIGQGVKSGQLTPEELQKLKTEQKAIRAEEKAYKSDGVLTKDERKDLHQDLNQASKDIYAEKHDGETQPGVTPAEPKPLGTKDPGVNQRQSNQEQRIKEGVKSGELTRREAHTLAEKEAHLAMMEKRLKSDGSLSAEDRARLQHRLDFLSKEIAREKHDGQTKSTTGSSTTTP